MLENMGKKISKKIVKRNEEKMETSKVVVKRANFLFARTKKVKKKQPQQKQNMIGKSKKIANSWQKKQKL